MFFRLFSHPYWPKSLDDQHRKHVHSSCRKSLVRRAKQGKDDLSAWLTRVGCRQIGLLLGPCFTILLKQLDFTFLGLNVTMYNSPGLLMAVLWIILAFLTTFFFFDLPSSTVRSWSTGMDHLFFSLSPFKTHGKSLSSSFNNSPFNEACRRACAICKKPVIIVRSRLSHLLNCDLSLVINRSMHSFSGPSCHFIYCLLQPNSIGNDIDTIHQSTVQLAWDASLDSLCRCRHWDHLGLHRVTFPDEEISRSIDSTLWLHSVEFRLHHCCVDLAILWARLSEILADLLNLRWLGYSRSAINRGDEHKSIHATHQQRWTRHWSRHSTICHQYRHSGRSIVRGQFAPVNLDHALCDDIDCSLCHFSDSYHLPFIAIKTRRRIISVDSAGRSRSLTAQFVVVFMTMSCNYLLLLFLLFFSQIAKPKLRNHTRETLHRIHWRLIW